MHTTELKQIPNKHIPDTYLEILSSDPLDIVTFALATESPKVLQQCIDALNAKAYIDFEMLQIGRPPLDVVNKARNEVKEALSSFGSDTLWQVQLKAIDMGITDFVNFNELRFHIYNILVSIPTSIYRNRQLKGLNTLQEA